MTRVFADTFYYLALLNADDDAHEQAVAFTENFTGTMLTTDWIVTELADGLAPLKSRQSGAEFIENLRSDPAVQIIGASRKILNMGWVAGAMAQDAQPGLRGPDPLQIIERGESDRLWRMIFQIDAGIAS